MLLLVFFLALPITSAQATPKSDIEKGVHVIEQLTSRDQKDPSCPAIIPVSTESCAALSDKECTSLLDEHDGNLNVFDGTILSGESEKSHLDLVQIMDYEALASSKERLPLDFQPRAAPVLDRLQAALKSENGSLAWKREIADIVRDFKRAMEDTAKERQDALYPELKDKRVDYYKVEEKLKADQILAKLNDEVVVAKYAVNPNWQRVERLFPQAKEDVMHAIDSLPIPEPKKSGLRERVRTVRLSLPLSNGHIASNTEDCATTDANAFYLPAFHSLEVCAGYFNAYQSDSALVTTIMHEISHSVDPERLASVANTNEGPVRRALEPLVGAKGSAISCEKWQALKPEILEMPLQNPPQPVLGKLLRCLEPTDQLEPWNSQKIVEISQHDANDSIHALAKDSSITKLAQPTFTYDNMQVPSQHYMRPDLWFARTKGRSSNSYSRSANGAEIFTQSLACQKISRADGTQLEFQAEALSDGDRAEMVAKAIAETKALLTKQNAEEYSYCGENCEDLLTANLGRPVNETFADWLAYRAGKFRLARIYSAEDRAKAALVARLVLCDQPGPVNSAPKVNAEELKYARDPHAQNRRRRISFFDADVAHMAGCEPTPGTTENFGNCEP